MTSVASRGAAERMAARIFSSVPRAGSGTAARYSSTVLCRCMDFVGQFDSAQDGFNCRIISGGYVEHHVVEVPVGPILAIVFVNERGSLAVDSRQQCFGLFAGLAPFDDPAHLLGIGRVEEDVKRVVSLPKEPGSSAADNHALSFLRDLEDYFFEQPGEVFGIEQFEAGVGLRFET